MATRKDEFDPPDWMLSKLIDCVVIPILADVAEEIGVACQGSVTVYIRDRPQWKTNIDGFTTTLEEFDENTEIRLRFRRTIRNDRVLYSMDTQHADVWRKSGFSGVWLRGDIISKDGKCECRIRHKQMCYNGWHDW